MGNAVSRCLSMNQFAVTHPIRRSVTHSAMTNESNMNESSGSLMKGAKRPRFRASVLYPSRCNEGGSPPLGLATPVASLTHPERSG